MPGSEWSPTEREGGVIDPPSLDLKSTNEPERQTRVTSKTINLAEPDGCVRVQ